MAKIEFQIVEVFGRVLAFIESNQGKLSKTSVVWLALGRIREAIAKMYDLSAMQKTSVVSTQLPDTTLAASKFIRRPGRPLATR